MAKIRFSPDALLAAFAAAIVLAVGVFLWNSLGDAHPAAVRNQYFAGQITLEKAVREVGDVAYEWVESKARRDAALP